MDKIIKDTEKYRLLCFTRWGNVCLNNLYPNKTKAIQKGREMKRYNFAFSYIVYERYIGEDGNIKRLQVAKG